MNLFTDAQHFSFLRGIGYAAVLYFFVKGLLWVIAPFAILYLA